MTEKIGGLFLVRELQDQKIVDFRIWEGIRDNQEPKRGISKAHKNIVMCDRENKLPYILIAEDDLNFTATGSFDFFMSNIPTDFDIYLAGIMYGKLLEDNSVNDFSGITLYLLNQRFYEKFLSLPEDRHIDRALANKGKFIVCNPMAAIQHNGYSDNSKRILNYEPYLRKRKLFGRENTDL